jgi:hypothetical protein
MSTPNDKQSKQPDETSRSTAEPTSAASEPGGVSRRTFVGAAAGLAAAAATAPATAFAAGANPIYRIHPAIGFARLGNADPSSFFIGPEAPGYGPLGDAPGTSVPPYKQNGKVKPQGVRFRVYEYATVNNRLVPVREITLDTPGVSAIKWNVHLANKKSSYYKIDGRRGDTTAYAGLRNAGVTDRRSLEIDFGAREINGKNQAPVEFRPGGSATPALESCPKNVAGQPVIDYLGQLRTDGQGRLIVLGGQGKSSYASATPPPLTTWDNNDGWFDDASDGPVTASVTIVENGVSREVPIDDRGTAWIISGPPDFAPHNRGAVTGYDLLFDLAVRSIPIPVENGLYDQGQPLGKLKLIKDQFKPGADFELPTYVPDFSNDIQPILVAGYNYWFVTGVVTEKHNSLIAPGLGNPSTNFNRDRATVFQYMRPPEGVTSRTGKRTMPAMLGDDPYIGGLPDAVRKLALTHVQFAMVRRWANNVFTPATNPPTSPPPAQISPTGLDQAALETTVGGAFFPGIEFGWQLRNPSLYVEPFRLKKGFTSAIYGESGKLVGPGHFTRQMAIPWQADFNDCRNEGNYGWWPSQRPTDVLPSISETNRVPWARPTTRFASNAPESTYDDMMANWYKFGFVIEEGGVFYETERDPNIT